MPHRANHLALVASDIHKIADLTPSGQPDKETLAQTGTNYGGGERLLGADHK